MEIGREGGEERERGEEREGGGGKKTNIRHVFTFISGRKNSAFLSADIVPWQFCGEETG